MVEKASGYSITQQELDLILKDLHGRGASQIALGYLLNLRESPEVQKQSLQEIHEKALKNLIPGDDYEAYKLMHTQAYNYLVTNSERFDIKVSRD